MLYVQPLCVKDVSIGLQVLKTSWPKLKKKKKKAAGELSCLAQINQTKSKCHQTKDKIHSCALDNEV